MVTLQQLVTQKAAILGPNFSLGKDRGLFLRYSRYTGWSLRPLSWFGIFLRSFGFFPNTHLHRIYYRMRKEPNVPPALLAKFENLWWNSRFLGARPYVAPIIQPAQLPPQRVMPPAPNPIPPMQPAPIPAQRAIPAAPIPIPQFVINPPRPRPILGYHWCGYNRSNIWAHPGVWRLGIPADQALEGFPELALARSFLQTPDLFLQTETYDQQIESALITGAVEKEGFKRQRNIAQNDRRIPLAEGAAHFGIRQNQIVELRIEEENNPNNGYRAFQNLIRTLLPTARQNGGLLAVVLSRDSESFMIGIDLRRPEEPRYHYFNSQRDPRAPNNNEGAFSSVRETVHDALASIIAHHRYREVVVPADAALNVFRGVVLVR